MDPEQAQTQSIDTQPLMSVAPPASGGADGNDGGVCAAPGPAAGADGNPVLASVAPADGAPAVPAAAPAPAAAAAANPVLSDLKDVGSIESSAGDFMSAAAKAGSPMASDATSKMVGGGLGFVGDVTKSVDGIQELADGKYLQGAIDTGKGVVGTAKDLADMTADTGASKVLGDVGDKFGAAGAAMNLGKDVDKTGKGIDEIRKADNFSDGAQGVLDTAGGLTSMVSDGSKAMSPFVEGGVKVPGLAVAKGAVEVGQTAKDIYDVAADHDSLASGESRKDGADAAVDMVDHGLHAISDIGSNATGPVGAVSKAFGVGMDVGNVIAPHVFDAKQASNAQTADGQFHGSTGNGAVDWVFGVGKYSNGRMNDSSSGNGG